MQHVARPSVVYIARNTVNGKTYVGVTSTSLEHRRRGHARNHRYEKSKTVIFHKAIKKYGIDAFHFSVLCECSSFTDALAKERQAIAELKPDYNMTAGGEGALGFKHSPETIERLRVISRRPHLGRRGVKRPQEVNEKNRAAKLANPTRYWLGKPRSEETKEKIKLALQGRPGPKETPLMRATRVDNVRKASEAKRRPVVCLDDGIVYPSAKEAAQAYGFITRSISAVCSKKCPSGSLYGKTFRYVDEVEDGQ